MCEVVLRKLIIFIKNRKWNDWFFLIVLLLVLFMRGPSLIDQFQKQGTQVKPVVMNGQLFPPVASKSVLVFWASWCGPCTIELGRIQSALDKHEISPIHIYAVNTGESKDTVNKVINERQLKIPVVLDESGLLSNLFSIKGTPTVVFIDESGKINWISSGVSPTLIYRIKYFLKD